MASLRDIAELAMDAFYQDYAPDDAFFDVEDFKYRVAAYYSTRINDEYQAIRKTNKQETGYSSVDISPQWLIEQKVANANTTDTQITSKLIRCEERDLWYVKTKYPIFSFDYDSFANGLNGVRPLKGGRQLKKISINEIRFLDQVPITNDVFYWVEGVDKVYITQNLDLTLYYIPAVLGADDQCVMADTCVAEVIEKTLTLMFGAKNGNIIQKADDQNKNLILPQQVNPDLGKQ